MELIEHYDAARYGSQHIDAQTRGVRIVDLIRSKETGPDALPMSPAAEYVIGVLEGQGEALRLYQSGGTGWAAPIPLNREIKLTKQRTENFDEMAIRLHRQRIKTGQSALSFVSRIPRVVTYSETKRVAWLSVLRDELVSSRTRKGLENPSLVALVVLRSLANELFGCGPVAPALGVADIKAEALARAWKVVKAKGKDANWLPCHVEAVNKLRSLKVSDAEIAREMGISRARVQQECKTRSEAEAAATPGHAATAAAVQALAR